MLTRIDVAAAMCAVSAVLALWMRRKARPPARFVAALAEYQSSSDGDAPGKGTEWLGTLAAAVGEPIDSVSFAEALDASDLLHHLRDEFSIPEHADGRPQAYFAGNSLGLQPKRAALEVHGEMVKWAARGVNGHFEGSLPWATCEEYLPPLFAELVGSKHAALEVGAMNSLTVNLHMLMAAFYRPSAGRAAIIIEAGAFPSDRYAVGSQIRHHGKDPDEWLIEVQPRADSLLHTEDIIAAIEMNKSRLALVLLGGVNFLTGQVLDMPAISAHMVALNAANAKASLPAVPFGLDLAHAIGNVPLHLNEWKVDFAAWCTYKYLNAGAGCLAGLFVHECHAKDGDIYPRLSGWWGVPFSKRFTMAHQFVEAEGAAGFGVSNVNPLMVACVHASLLVFRKAGGVAATRKKAILTTSYLEVLLRSRDLLMTDASQKHAQKPMLYLITPTDSKRRGCQLSLRVVAATEAASSGKPPMTMRALEAALQELGVVGDAREPDILRIAPAPLYNSFSDVRRAVDALEMCLA